MDWLIANSTIELVPEGTLKKDEPDEAELDDELDDTEAEAVEVEVVE